jgi:putative ABC transport system permease protein
MANARYFDALGITVLRGRAFSSHDVASSAPVCIVNEEFVRRHLQGREPLGAIVKVPNVAFGRAMPISRAIVGVIKQVTVQPGASDKTPQLYVPLEQNAWYATTIALRTAGNPRALAEPARAAAARVDRDLPLTRIRTMEDLAADSVMRPRFRAGLVVVLAALALGLAAVGLFGVLTCSVRERLREFGVRLALGAQAADILTLVIGSGLRMTAAGIAIGLLLSTALTRTLAALLYGVTPLDPISYAVAALVFGMTALIASATPALLALRTDPAVTLRQD